MHPLDPEQTLYQPCANPLCDGLVRPSVAYCCGSCAKAHDGHYEIHENGPLGHTPGCQEIQAERAALPLHEVEPPEPVVPFVQPWRPPPPPVNGWVRRPTTITYFGSPEDRE